MKHVRRPGVEPPSLAAYRVAWPDEERRPASEAKIVWEGFKSDPTAYHDLLRSLVNVQQGLCLYCEQRLVDSTGSLVPHDYQVEHVLPKSGGPRRALDWTNLALACAGGTYPHHPDWSRQHSDERNNSCGQTKLDKELPARCDPRDFSLLDGPVEVGLDGRAAANHERCGAAGISPGDLSDVIEQLLNLNCERLRKARQDVGDNLRSWIVPLLRELLSAHLSPDQQRAMTDLTVAGRLQPDQSGHLRRFWSTERGALGDIAEAWIRANQGMFI